MPIYVPAFLFVPRVHVTTFLPDSVHQHNTRLVHLDDHGYDAEGRIMEEIPAGGCSSMCTWWMILASAAIPIVIKTPRKAGLGECNVGLLHPDNDEVAAVRRRYAGSGKEMKWILALHTRPDTSLISCVCSSEQQ